MKKILSILVVMLMALPAMAQSSKITAKVIDSETKDGVIGAIVEVVSKRNEVVLKTSTLPKSKSSLSEPFWQSIRG